jgi:hypothetical protein
VACGRERRGRRRPTGKQIPFDVPRVELIDEAVVVDVRRVQALWRTEPADVEPLDPILVRVGHQSVPIGVPSDEVLSADG